MRVQLSFARSRDSKKQGCSIGKFGKKGSLKLV
jgi:hypothetical protein